MLNVIMNIFRVYLFFQLTENIGQIIIKYVNNFDTFQNGKIS